LFCFVLFFVIIVCFLFLTWRNERQRRTGLRMLIPLCYWGKEGVRLGTHVVLYHVCTCGELFGDAADRLSCCRQELRIDVAISQQVLC
jgi:hypothetical protein